MITVIANSGARRIRDIERAVAGQSQVELRTVTPDRVLSEVQTALGRGAERIAVAGGDGTIATAASAVAGTGAALAVIPAGTLNHFASDLGIPLDLDRAIDVAVQSTATAAVDVGRVNDRLMLNTSAVGAYAAFVRTRDRLEHRYGYRIASVLAAIRTLLRLRSLRVQFEVEGSAMTYRTPLLFVGVGEREVRIPMLGARIHDGRRGLHVFVLRKGSAFGFLTAAALGALRGSDHLSRTDHVDSYLVDQCQVHLRRRTIVAIDGELAALPSPLDYRIERDVLRVVVPGDAA